MFHATVDSEDFATTWVGVRAAVRAGMRRGVSQGVQEGAAEAKTKHVFKNRTGDLERSIVGRLTGNRTSVGASRGTNIPSSQSSRTSLDPNDGAQFGLIEATMPYASFVENGTRPHLILPKKGRWLAWERPAGEWHFAQRVNHPGSRPHPYMSFAYLKCERVMIREIERGIADAQKILDSD
jgi:hypothetical protein